LNFSRKIKPFCDGSHENTAFRPVRFVIEEECEKIELCGCKFSKNAPFCDKSTCVNLKGKASENIEKKAS
jgi:CDGSH-type Zn-finger protein